MSGDEARNRAEAAAMTTMKYLCGYPEPLVSQVRRLMAEGRLAPLLAKRYPAAHAVRTDAALYAYVGELKAAYMRKAEPLSRVASLRATSARTFFSICAAVTCTSA